MKILILAFLVLILFYGCSSVPITGRRQLNLVSDSEILSLSNKSYTSYLSSAKVVKNTPQSIMVNNCGNKIKNAVEQYIKSANSSSQLNGYNWEFILSQDDTPNAFCMPGGKVVVYSGILPFTQDETGLAVVIGHEIAHAVAKHSNERISQQMVIEMGGSLLNSYTGSKSAILQGVVSNVYGLGSNVAVTLPFSRKQEYEADKLGLIFMAMAGYDPSQAVEFWSKMSQKSSSSVPEFLSTHPADANRISYIKSILPEIKSKYYK